MTRKLGRIKMLNREKGFGFITANDGTGDVFFHYSGLAEGESFDLLAPTQEVSFSTEDAQPRPRAIHVKGMG